MLILNRTLNAILLFNSSYKELCIEQIRPILKKANTIRNYDYDIGNCTFPAQSSNLQNYGSCSINSTECAGNVITGVEYSENRCNAPIFWYNDDIEKSITYWDIGNIESFTCNPYYLA